MGLPAKASVTTLENPTVPVQRKIASPHSIGEINDARIMRESLSHDVARHPGDFVVFATEVGAQQFVAEHRHDVERETNTRIVSRGVVGYWQGKTIVILPWGPYKNF
jgi:hypothetical protein